MGVVAHGGRSVRDPKDRKGGQADLPWAPYVWAMKAETRSFYEAAVERAAHRVIVMLDDALDLELLAREAALSPFHFHRVFRGMIGETPLELHRRLRLERAALQLRQSSQSITAIAFSAGYETHEAFTRAFRSAYGCAPSTFRSPPSVDAESTHRRTTSQSIQLAARSGIHYSAEGRRPTIVFARGGVSMQVSIEQLPSLRVACVRHVGPYLEIGQAFGRLGAIAEGSSAFAAPDTLMLAIFHDDPESVAPSQLQSDAGLTIAEGVPLPDGLQETRITAGRYARATHQGPYEGLNDAWSRLMGEWLPSSGHRVGEGRGFEVYRNTPMTAAPEALLTDLYLPIA